MQILTRKLRYESAYFEPCKLVFCMLVIELVRRIKFK